MHVVISTPQQVLGVLHSLSSFQNPLTPECHLRQVRFQGQMLPHQDFRPLVSLSSPIKCCCGKNFDEPGVFSPYRELPFSLYISKNYFFIEVQLLN